MRGSGVSAGQSPETALDPLGIRLAGLHLIEASAGTGKTYAIAHLVLRLILESGRRVDEVLVLTFTEAATEELKGRIARRLREARDLLAAGQSAEPAGDPLLAETLARLPSGRSWPWLAWTRPSPIWTVRPSARSTASASGS